MQYDSNQAQDRPLVRWNPRGSFRIAEQPVAERPAGGGDRGSFVRDAEGNCVLCIESETLGQTVCEQVSETICQAVGV